MKRRTGCGAAATQWLLVRETGASLWAFSQPRFGLWPLAPWAKRIRRSIYGVENCRNEATRPGELRVGFEKHRPRERASAGMSVSRLRVPQGL